MPRYPTQVVPFAAASNFTFTNEASVGNPATDIFTIRGSDTRKVIVLGVKVVQNVPADAATLNYLFLVRRSSIGTGGAQTAAFNSFALDRSGVSATASCFGWTTSPTALGTLVGNVDMSPTAGTGAVAPQDPHAAQSLLTVPFSLPGDVTGVTLPTANDCLSVNLGTVGRTVVGGMSFFVAAYWLEVIGA